MVNSIKPRGVVQRPNSRPVIDFGKVFDEKWSEAMHRFLQFKRSINWNCFPTVSVEER